MLHTEIAYQKEKREPKISYDLEVGALLFKSGNFGKSVPHLKRAMRDFAAKKDFSRYFHCYSLLLQALNELGNRSAVHRLKKTVEAFCSVNKLANNPKALACSAYYSIYIEKKFDKARKELNTALKTAFARRDKALKRKLPTREISARFEIINCLYVYGIYYFETGDYNKCLNELENLKSLIKSCFKLKQEIQLSLSRTDNSQELGNHRRILEELDKHLPLIEKIQMGLKFFYALVEIKKFKNYRRADRLLWDVYEEAGKSANTFFIPYILYSMAWCNIKLSNRKQALMLFNLAQKHTHKERKTLTNYRDKLKQQENLGLLEKKATYDLIFDAKEHTLMEKQKGCVEIKNQFVLMDLLCLLMGRPGLSYSKKEIVKKLWKTKYTPSKDDNKLYVTVKRLRDLIEPDSQKPRYIKRGYGGYYFSDSFKILLKK